MNRFHFSVSEPYIAETFQVKRIFLYFDHFQKKMRGKTVCKLGEEINFTKQQSIVSWQKDYMFPEEVWMSHQALLT
jgi:hypothetical protein